MDVRYTDSAIEIYYRNKRLVTHEILIGTGQYFILDEHRPASHKRVLEGEPQAMMMWAESFGINTKKMFTYHLSERADITNGVKAAKKMRELARLHGAPRFEAVCSYALTLN